MDKKHNDFYQISLPHENLPNERSYVNERIKDLIVYTIYAENFKNLNLKDKLLAYWLSEASKSGRDIYYQQLTSQGLKIRAVLEGILSEPEGIDTELLEKIKYYAYRFWDASCNYDSKTYKKFLPAFSFEDLRTAALMAKENGVNFKLEEEQSLENLLLVIKKPMFDKNVEPYLVNTNQEDIIKASAVNFYKNVTEIEARAFYKDSSGKNPLNSKHIKDIDKIKELVYSSNGLYGQKIRGIIENLKQAKPYMTPSMTKALDYLIQYYQTGDTNKWREFNKIWAVTKSNVDFINGFVEVYNDPLNLKGSFEGIVGYINTEKLEQIQKLLDNVQYYEDSQPWSDEYKKTWQDTPVVNPVDVVSEIGDAMSCCTIGINLPNESDIREHYGSKNFMLENVIETIDIGSKQAYGTKVLEEFALPNEWEDDIKYETNTDWVHTLFHEIIGHGSGKVSDNLTKDPSEYILENYNALEEARAELVALYQIDNHKTLELGLIPDKKAVDAHYRAYVRDDLLMLRKYDTASGIGEAHDRARHLIVQYLIRHENAVSIIKQNSKTYYIVNDTIKMHEGVGKLLALVQHIKATGDYKTASELVDTYGVDFDAELRDEVVSRYTKLDVPKYSVALRPLLIPIYDVGNKSNIIDVNVYYPKNLIEENLAYSGIKTPIIEYSQH